MTEEQQPQVQSLKKPIWASWWFWLIIIAVIAIIIFTGGSKNGEITPETVTPTQEVPEDDFLIETDSSDKEETEPVSEQETQADFPVQEDGPTDQQPAGQQDECSVDEECQAGHKCLSGMCQLIVCQPDCVGKTCGDDGCGGVCGTCDPIYTCVDGQCIIPILDI